MSDVARLKVTLKGIRPPIWRRLELPLDLPMARVSDVILAAFGWSNSHLHEFTVGERRIGRPDPDDVRLPLRLLDSPVAAAGADLVGFFARPPLEDESRLDLGTALAGGVPRLSYTCDVGDDWRHVVHVEAILPAETRFLYPRCTAARRACLPEDCGGVWGYEQLIAVLADPSQAEYAALREWCPFFDPEEFDRAAADQAVRHPPEYWG